MTKKHHHNGKRKKTKQTESQAGETKKTESLTSSKDQSAKRLVHKNSEGHLSPSTAKSEAAANPSGQKKPAEKETAAQGRKNGKHEVIYNLPESPSGLRSLENGGRMSDLLDPELRRQREEKQAARRAAEMAAASHQPDGRTSQKSENSMENSTKDKKEAAPERKSTSGPEQSSQPKKKLPLKERLAKWAVRTMLKPGFWCLLAVFCFLVWVLITMLKLGLLKMSFAALVLGLGMTGMAIAAFWFFMTRSRLWNIPAILLCASMILGTVFLEGFVSRISTGIASLDSAGEELTIKSGLYVPSAVPLASLPSLEGQTVGILGSRSDVYNQKVIDQLSSQGVTFDTRSFSTLQQLYKAVRGQSVRAAILSPADVQIIHEFSDGNQINGGLSSAFSTDVVSETVPYGADLNLEKDPYTVLISGSRGAVTDPSYNSTLNLLVTVNPSTSRVLVTVVPRALAVSTACSADLGCSGQEEEDRVGLMSYHTADVLAQSLEQEFGVDINFTVRMDINTISQIFDIVPDLYTAGGHEYSLTTPLTENEKRAMSSPKIRQILGTLSDYSGSDADLELNQFVMLNDIGAACSKISSGNVSQIFKILDSSVQSNFSYDQLCTLIRQYVLLPEPKEYYFSTVSGTYETRYSPMLTESTYMLIANEDSLNQARTAIQQTLAGETPSASGIETGKTLPSKDTDENGEKKDIPAPSTEENSAQPEQENAPVEA